MEAVIFISSSIAFIVGVIVGMYMQYQVQNENIESLEKRLKMYQNKYEDDGYEAY